MKILSRLVAGIALLSLLPGCALLSENDEGEVAPPPLVEFNPQAVLNTQWSARVGSGVGNAYIKLKPAIDGNIIYAADVKGVVTALDRNTGKQQWRVHLDEKLSGGVGVGFGLVLLGTESGRVLALNQDDGQELWRATVSSEVLAAPKSNANTVVVQTLDEKIYGFDHATGEWRWHYESSTIGLSLRGTSSPIVTSEIAIMGMGNGQVIALNPDTGDLLWKQRANVPQGRSEFERMSDVDGDLLLAGGTLYVTSFQGYVAAFNIRTGKALWRRKLSSFHGPDEGLGNLYISDASDEIYALDQNNNEVVWVQSGLINRKITAPVTLGNYLAVADSQGYLHILLQRDGSFFARKKIDSSGVSSPMIAKGNTLYVYGNSGKLVALTVDSSSGE